jgi:CRISPR-associated protein Csb2
LFNALTASWGRTGEAPEGKEALLWLESLPPPLICASDGRAGRPHEIFVPQNDRLAGKAELIQLLPSHRTKVEKSRVSFNPENPEVIMMWPDAEAGQHGEVLDGLCRSVSYLGQSSSMVSMKTTQEQREPTHVPVDHVTGISLRVPRPGRLQSLIDFHARGQRPRPVNVGMVSYGTTIASSATLQSQTAYGEWETLRLSGNLPFEARHARSLVTSFRRTLLGRAASANGHSGPISPAISGHEADGSPTRAPHIAIIPLMNVGYPFSDGRMRGLAIVRPASFSIEDERLLQDILLAPTTDEDGVVTETPITSMKWPGFGTCGLKLETINPSLRSLAMGRYLRPADHWATVLPYRFEGMRKRRFSTPAGDRETFSMVSRSCERIGLPAPAGVRTVYRSPISGVQDLKEFPADSYRRGFASRHLIIRFSEPVGGPVLIGADRFRGFGLCLPLAQDHEGS